MDKMSELSKPVAYIAECGTIVCDSDPFFDDYKNPKPIYSQEYVSALLAELEAKDKRIAELDRSETQLIEERDVAHDAIDAMYEAATGERPEWSNWFVFADAVEEVAQVRAELANREAQPVALVDRRPAASGSICWQNGGKDLPHGTELFTAPPAPAYPERLPCPVHLLPGLKFGKGVPTRSMLDALVRRAEYESEREAMTPEQKAEDDARIEAFKALLPRPPAPAVPEAIITAPIEAMRCGPAASYVLGWNACRASMLAAALEES